MHPLMQAGPAAALGPSMGPQMRRNAARNQRLKETWLRSGGLPAVLQRQGVVPSCLAHRDTSWSTGQLCRTLNFHGGCHMMPHDHVGVSASKLKVSHPRTEAHQLASSPVQSVSLGVDHVLDAVVRNLDSAAQGRRSGLLLKASLTSHPVCKEEGSLEAVARLSRYAKIAGYRYRCVRGIPWLHVDDPRHLAKHVISASWVLAARCDATPRPFGPSCHPMVPILCQAVHMKGKWKLEPDLCSSTWEA